jgi:hypothetical protein
MYSLIHTLKRKRKMIKSIHQCDFKIFSRILMHMPYLCVHIYKLFFFHIGAKAQEPILKCY